MGRILGHLKITCMLSCDITSFDDFLGHLKDHLVICFRNFYPFLKRLSWSSLDSSESLSSMFSSDSRKNDMQAVLKNNSKIVIQTFYS